MAIADLLREVLPRSGTVLEVASGSGEHAAYFACEFPALEWQPSDPDPAARVSIAAWCDGLDNVLPPLDLDATQGSLPTPTPTPVRPEPVEGLPSSNPARTVGGQGFDTLSPNGRGRAQPSQGWPVDHADAVLCINMVHISPWAATLGLMAGAAHVLAAGAPLILYGPFLQAEKPTAPSNLAFDESLRARDPRWGIRSVEAVGDAAAGFTLDRIIAMPANNLMLVFRRN